MNLTLKYRFRPRWRYIARPNELDEVDDNGYLRRRFSRYVAPSVVARKAYDTFAEVTQEHEEAAEIAHGLWSYYEFADEREFVDEEVIDLLDQLAEAPRTLPLLKKCIMKTK